MSFKTAKSHIRKCIFDDLALHDEFSPLKLIKRGRQTIVRDVGGGDVGGRTV